MTIAPVAVDEDTWDDEAPAQAAARGRTRRWTADEAHPHRWRQAPAGPHDRDPRTLTLDFEPGEAREPGYYLTVTHAGESTVITALHLYADTLAEAKTEAVQAVRAQTAGILPAWIANGHQTPPAPR